MEFSSNVGNWKHSPFLSENPSLQNIQAPCSSEKHESQFSSKQTILSSPSSFSHFLVVELKEYPVTHLIQLFAEHCSQLSIWQ